MANVVNNYVEALYYSTNNSLDRTQIEKDLQKFVEISNDNSNLKKVLKDPRIENEVKFQIIDGIVGKENKLLSNFLKLLVKEKRVDLIEGMLLEYEKLMRNSKKELFIKIIVSSEIDDNQIEKIVQKFKDIYKVNAVKYVIEINKEILGGIKVVVGRDYNDNELNFKALQNVSLNKVIYLSKIISDGIIKCIEY